MLQAINQNYKITVASENVEWYTKQVSEDIVNKGE